MLLAAIEAGKTLRIFQFKKLILPVTTGKDNAVDLLIGFVSAFLVLTIYFDVNSSVRLSIPKERPALG